MCYCVTTLVGYFNSSLWMLNLFLVQTLFFSAKSNFLPHHPKPEGAKLFFIHTFSLKNRGAYYKSLQQLGNKKTLAVKFK